MTLPEVAQRVVLTNPEVLAKWHNFLAAKSDVDIAKAGFYPRIDITAGAGKEQIKLDGVADNNFSRDGYTLTLNQMLYDGFATLGDVRRVDKTRLVRYFELIDVAESAALEAARVYLDVLRYRQLVYLAENNYIEHRSSYEQLVRRAQAGAGRRVDVEHAAGRLALAELNLNTEAANLHDVMARFMRLVGIPAPAVMFPPGQVDRGFPSDEADALELALKQNPTLRIAIENVQAAQHELELRRGAFHPRVDLKLRSENSSNYQGLSAGRQNNIAEVLVSYNFFNGFADSARVENSVQRKHLAMDLREKACRDIRQTLSIAYNDVARLRAQLSNLAVQVAAVEKTRDAYKAQFNIGQRSLLDLLDTEGELLNARRTSVHADMDLYLAYLRTHAGIGRLLKFLKLKRLGDDNIPDPTDITKVEDSELCPPDAPSKYNINIEALTAIALSNVPAQGPVSAVTLSDPTPNSPSNPAAPKAPEAVAAQLKAWSAAWAATDFQAYSSFYAKTFVPEDGISRSTWTARRADRLRKAKKVDVKLSQVSLERVSPTMIVSRFTQDYRSDSYSDRTNKILRWVEVGGKWLIESEAIDGGGQVTVPTTDRSVESAKP
jgi:outer membrane protein, adhesin transport system